MELRSCEEEFCTVGCQLKRGVKILKESGETRYTTHRTHEYFFVLRNKLELRSCEGELHSPKKDVNRSKESEQTRYTSHRTDKDGWNEGIIWN